jgi:uncharacterized protein
MRGLRLLQKHGVEYNVLTTVNRVNADYPLEVYRFLRDEVGTTWMQFIPVSRADQSDGLTLYQEGSRFRALGAARSSSDASSCAIFDEWVRHDVGASLCRLLRRPCATGWACPRLACASSTRPAARAWQLSTTATSTRAITLSSPTTCWATSWMTHMIELVVASTAKFGLDKRDTCRACLECDVRFACHGECPKNRFILTTRTVSHGLNYLCAGFKEFFHHASFSMKIMAGLIRRGREAKEVMEILDHTFTGVHRLDPCPCGSGRKFRQCHGRQPVKREFQTLPPPQTRSSVYRKEINE